MPANPQTACVSFPDDDNHEQKYIEKFPSNQSDLNIEDEFRVFDIPEIARLGAEAFFQSNITSFEEADAALYRVGNEKMFLYCPYDKQSMMRRMLTAIRELENWEGKILPGIHMFLKTPVENSRKVIEVKRQKWYVGMKAHKDDRNDVHDLVAHMHFLPQESLKAFEEMEDEMAKIQLRIGGNKSMAQPWAVVKIGLCSMYFGTPYGLNYGEKGSIRGTNRAHHRLELGSFYQNLSWITMRLKIKYINEFIPSMAQQQQMCTDIVEVIRSVMQEEIAAEHERFSVAWENFATWCHQLSSSRRVGAPCGTRGPQKFPFGPRGPSGFRLLRAGIEQEDVAWLDFLPLTCAVCSEEFGRDVQAFYDHWFLSNGLTACRFNAQEIRPIACKSSFCRKNLNGHFHCPGVNLVPENIDSKRKRRWPLERLSAHIKGF